MAITLITHNIYEIFSSQIDGKCKIHVHFRINQKMSEYVVFSQHIQSWINWWRKGRWRMRGEMREKGREREGDRKGREGEGERNWRRERESRESRDERALDWNWSLSVSKSYACEYFVFSQLSYYILATTNCRSINYMTSKLCLTMVINHRLQ